jgi:hypothetical protein
MEPSASPLKMAEVMRMIRPCLGPGKRRKEKAPLAQRLPVF